MDKKILSILLLSMLIINYVPCVFGEDQTIEVLYTVIAESTMKVWVQYGTMTVNTVRTEELFSIDTPAINDTVNLTILHNSGVGDANYRFIAPAGSKDGWATGKTIQKDTIYSIPIDKLGSYYLEIAPIRTGDRNASVIIGNSPYLNITTE